MKTASLSYHSEFPGTPISSRAGARWWAWVVPERKAWQPIRPVQIEHPFLLQRKKWCRLNVHFNNVDLYFAMPEELDHFIEVMSQNPLPSGRSLVPDCRIGRPNKHWLSRLPARAKPWKFRQAVCEYLLALPEAKEFRNFYGPDALQFEFEGYFDSFDDAYESQASLK